MQKLKVAVDVYHRISFLEKFPNDEEHAGLQEIIDAEYSDFEAKEDIKPGLYLATLDFEQYRHWDGEPDVYLNVVQLEPIGG